MGTPDEQLPEGMVVEGMGHARSGMGEVRPDMYTHPCCSRQGGLRA